MGFLFKYPAAQILIGLVGGGFLVHMGVQLLLSLRNLEATNAKSHNRHPVTIGVILTAGNPYFLMWWATVGLNLSIEARALGPLAFVIFALLHWLCDAVWLESLSYASFKGTTVFGPRSQRIVLAVCSAAMIVLGVWFIVDAGRSLLAPGQR
jgi:threonine/homoserine/homoserine lactone efflux protein